MCRVTSMEQNKIKDNDRYLRATHYFGTQTKTTCLKSIDDLIVFKTQISNF